MAEPVFTAPAGGEKITIRNGKLQVPEQPIIPYIEGVEHPHRGAPDIGTGAGAQRRGGQSLWRSPQDSLAGNFRR